MVEVVAAAMLHSLKAALEDQEVVVVEADTIIQYTHQPTDSINRPQEIMPVQEPTIQAVVVALQAITAATRMVLAVVAVPV